MVQVWCASGWVCWCLMREWNINGNQCRNVVQQFSLQCWFDHQLVMTAGYVPAFHPMTAVINSRLPATLNRAMWQLTEEWMNDQKSIITLIFVSSVGTIMIIIIIIVWLSIICCSYLLGWVYMFVNYYLWSSKSNQRPSTWNCGTCWTRCPLSNSVQFVTVFRLSLFILNMWYLRQQGGAASSPCVSVGFHRFPPTVQRLIAH